MISPKILKIKWGRMEIEGLGSGKDFMLWPGGGRSWDWRQSGTSHSAGIQVSDCRELVKNGSKVVVLSRGMFQRLKISPQTLVFLDENSIEVKTAETKKAVEIYNTLALQGQAVGGLFHSTC